MNAREKIEELALRVAEDALSAAASPEDRREALKILNAHYTMLLKSKAKIEEPSDDFDFDRFNQESLDGNDGTKMGSRSGRA
jgi:hypothetical protein